jgi:hypothetical protein
MCKQGKSLGGCAWGLLVLLFDGFRPLLCADDEFQI